MSIRGSRRFWMGLVALSVSSTACSAPPVKTQEYSVVLRSEKQANGHYKAIAYPDKLPIIFYDNDKNDSIVTWKFKHKSTKIRFDPPPPSAPPIPKITDPTCVAGTCTLKLPAGLAPREGTFRYKYTITGKHDDNNDLDPNDPEIEIDR